MKVKIGDKIYNGKKEPVMVILTDQDKENIANMLPECTRYCMYPKNFFENTDACLDWMEKEN